MYIFTRAILVVLILLCFGVMVFYYFFQDSATLGLLGFLGIYVFGAIAMLTSKNEIQTIPRFLRED